MIRCIFFTLLVCSFTFSVTAQTREELEKQRQQLRNEIEETEKLLKTNKTKTQESLAGLMAATKRSMLQERVIDNINKDLRLLDNNIYTIQRDINRYDRLLDTLKAEYAKSMVYSYKNRGNYEFLNFIFSASSFNDAIKRIAYLKSYRNYQEIQGENILRTQELRKNRVADLTGSKREKSSTLQTQSKEMAVLETQKKEQDRIVNELKKQGKSLNNQIAAKKKQMQKVSNAIAAAIKRAQEEAKREALAKAAAEEKRRKEAEKANTAKTTTPKENNNPTTTTTTKSVAPKKVTTPTKAPENVLLNAENIALNNNFEKNKGSLPWPVDKGYPMMHFGRNTLSNGVVLDLTNITIAADIGSSVKSVFDGTVTMIQSIDDMQVVIIQHGKYFTSYSNLSSVSVSKGQDVKTGQAIGKVGANFEGIGAIDFFMSNDKADMDPEKWLRRK